MTKHYNTESYVKEATLKHDGKYGYDQVVYTGSRESITIVCPHHGSFEQRGYLHLMGKGCRKCGSIKTGNKLRTKLEDCLRRFKKKHGDTYLYDQVVYVTNHTPVSIRCKRHGVFTQIPRVHYVGGYCPQCLRLGQYK